MFINSFIMLFVINSAKESHFSQSFCKYEQYIYKYCFIIVFAFFIWSSVLKWHAVENHESISSHVHNIFQKITTNWFSWSDMIMSDNSYNLKTFHVKISTISIIFNNFREIICFIFMSQLITSANCKMIQ